MSNKYLFIMSGIAGAGKSHFAEQLAKDLSVVWVSSDGVRSSMFEDAHDHSNMTDEKNIMVFSVMDYFSKQAFDSGISVIYDAANNTEPVRKKVRDFTLGCEAVPVHVLVETPTDVAFTRATTREDSLHSWTMPPERHEYNVAKFEQVIDTTNLIKIDGTESYHNQIASFKKQMNELGLGQ